MKPIDRRATPRFRVQFRTKISKTETQEGIGMVHDLSSGGCCLRSRMPVQRGLPLELRIHVPELEWPLMIDMAQVQWGRGQMIGLAFLRIRESEQRRLEGVMTMLVRQEDEELVASRTWKD